MTGQVGTLGLNGPDSTTQQGGWDLHPKLCCLWQDHMVTCSCFFRNLPQKLEIQVWPLFNIRVCVFNCAHKNVGTHDIWHTEAHHPRGYFQCQTWSDDNLFSHQSFLGVTQTFSAPASRPETSLIQVGFWVKMISADVFLHGLIADTGQAHSGLQLPWCACFWTVGGN